MARSDALAAVHAVHVAEEGSNDESADQPGSKPDESSGGASSDLMLDDEELIERATAAKNGEKFERLWRGDTSGYDSHSEADMALCALLAFWTGGDEYQVDRLFRQSGLYREKWDNRHFADGSTYGEKTVQRAVEGTKETYSPPDENPSRWDAPAELGTHRRELQSLTRLERLVETLTEENQQLKSDLEKVRQDRDEWRNKVKGDTKGDSNQDPSVPRRVRSLITSRFRIVTGLLG